MRSLLDYYQNIPLHIDPTALRIGSFSLGWYAIMYIVAFATIYFLLSYRIKKGEGEYSRNLILDFLFFVLVGVLIGGRLGYVLFYDPSYYWHNPLAIISPYDFATGQLVGIYGMSYHGGLIGVIIVAILFARKNNINPHTKKQNKNSKVNKLSSGNNTSNFGVGVNFWKLADFAVPAVPAGYFFGRIGNFLNLELYGRMTKSWIGMHFPLWTGAGPLLRYPSQLFEAFFEGLVLFAILWSLRNKKFFAGYFSALYMIGYGIFRFLVEFFRAPDAQIGYLFHYFTLGQALSLFMIVLGVGLYIWKKKQVINQS